MLTILSDTPGALPALLATTGLLDTLGDVGRWLFTVLYATVLVLICVYGIHRYALIYLFYRNRRKAPEPVGRFSEKPQMGSFADSGQGAGSVGAIKGGLPER